MLCRQFPSHHLTRSLFLLATLSQSLAFITQVAPQPAGSPPSITSAPTASPNAAAPATALASAPLVENSVVKVFSTIARPDPYRPWSKETPTDVTGSGTVISGKRILTNAHMVLYASQIEIQANQAGDKIAATVESVAPRLPKGF